MARLTAVLGDRELIQAELPPYEYPPPWIPIEQVGSILFSMDVWIQGAPDPEFDRF